MLTDNDTATDPTKDTETDTSLTNNNLLSDAGAGNNDLDRSNKSDGLSNGSATGMLWKKSITPVLVLACAFASFIGAQSFE